MNRSIFVLILYGAIFPAGHGKKSLAYSIFANISSDSELSCEDHDYSSSDSQVVGSEGITNEDRFEHLGLEPYQFEPEYSSSSEDETDNDQQPGGGQVHDENGENRLENSNW